MTSRSSARETVPRIAEVEHVRGEPALGFDGGEILQVVADEAAQVLDEPVEQRGEVQRIAGGAGVVVGAGSAGVPSLVTRP